MNLVDQFYSLTPPETINNNLFNTASLAEFPIAKIGISYQQFPILLISVYDTDGHLALKNIRLKYIELIYNTDCRILEEGKSTNSTFTVIVLKTNDKHLIKYFLQIAETFIKLLSEKPTLKEVSSVFKSFVEIFRAITGPPIKTVQGLWAELFLINVSKSPETLLSYWHSIPEEKFDFNADTEKLEVKSTGTLERVHTFASEQLTPQIDKQVLIVSMFVKQSSSGQNIIELTHEIKERVGNDQLKEKLYSIVSRSLGDSLDESVKAKFDSVLAKNSIRFFKHQEIDRIERIHIPNKVTNVRFKSDLSMCHSIELSDITNKGILFSAL